MSGRIAGSTHGGLIDPSAGFVWAVIALCVAVMAIWVAVTDFEFDPAILPALGCMAGWALFGLALQHFGWKRLGGLFETVAQLVLLGAAAPLVSVLLASTNLAYRDAELIAIDRWLGFDWRVLIDSTSNRPSIMYALNHIYASLAKQPLLLLVLLFLFDKGCAARLFVLAWAISLALTLFVFPLTPALGGYLHYGIRPEEVPQVMVPAAWRHIEILGPARDGTLLILGSKTLEGIITFPSFHAAASVILGWGFAGLPLLRWPGVALNAAMLASTPVIGGHYLIDVIAGSAIALLAIAGAKWLTPRSPMLNHGDAVVFNSARVEAGANAAVMRS